MSTDINKIVNGAQQGNVIAQYDLGFMYYTGIGLKQDYEKAVFWLEKAAEKNDADAQELLAVIYLFGLGKIKQDYEKARRLFNESFKNGNKHNKYYIDIFKKIKNNRIKIIKSMAEYSDQDIRMGVEAILIKPDYNFNHYAHTLYNINTASIMKKKLNQILKGVPEVNEKRTNEFEVFKQICINLVNAVDYDFRALDAFYKIIGEKIYSSRNLTGALLEYVCTCVGFVELLRNLCACRGIECIFVGSKNHAFNQVKIAGKWYYFEITKQRDKIRNNYNIIGDLLQSKERFQEAGDFHIPLEGQTTYESPNDYETDLKKRGQSKSQSINKQPMEVVAQNGLKGMTTNDLKEANSIMNTSIETKDNTKKEAK